jgi:RNA polymerase sigma-70 factor, ECF subfamily
MSLRLVPRSESVCEDQVIVARLLAGHEEAFNVFFEGQFPCLYRYTLSRIKDPEQTRDIVQATLCNAIAHLRSWRGESTLTAWLFTICSNEINGHFRRLKRRPETDFVDRGAPEMAAMLAALPSPDADPEQALGEKEVALLVHDTLDQLPPRYGKALEWKYVEGLPVDEIARRLEVGTKAAESLLSRARLAFRELFPKIGKWRPSPVLSA